MKRRRGRPSYRNVILPMIYEIMSDGRPRSNGQIIQRVLARFNKNKQHKDTIRKYVRIYRKQAATVSLAVHVGFDLAQAV